jgi:hypothetical protein
VSGAVPGLPAGTYVSRIAASARSAGTAYATFDAHRDGDFAPYVYRTTDFGATWTPLHQGLPTGSVNVIVEHPDNPDVLFLGTEHAAFASTDAGATWAKMPNLPTTAYDDLVIHPRAKDLVFGTHGRGIWILDDTRPFAEWIGSVVATPTHLFTIPSRPIFLYWKDTSYRGNAEFAGANPPDGVEVTYRLGPGAGSATLTVANERGDIVRELRIPSDPGTHRVNWDLRWDLDGVPDEWARFEHDLLARPIDQRGPFVSPGRYTVTLQARGTTSTRTMTVQADPLSDLTSLDYRTREEFMLGMTETMQEIDRRLQSATGTEADLLRQHRRTVGQVYGSMNGGGVRQGSLHPPTQTQRDRIDAVREALAGM